MTYTPSPERMDEIRRKRVAIIADERARVPKPTRMSLRGLSQRLRPSHILGRATQYLDPRATALNGEAVYTTGPRVIILNNRQNHTRAERELQRRAL